MLLLPCCCHHGAIQACGSAALHLPVKVALTRKSWSSFAAAPPAGDSVWLPIRHALSYTAADWAHPRFTWACRHEAAGGGATGLVHKCHRCRRQSAGTAAVSAHAWSGSHPGRARLAHVALALTPQRAHLQLAASAQELLPRSYAPASRCSSCLRLQECLCCIMGACCAGALAADVCCMAVCYSLHL